jgi:hypothetical protein
LRRAIFFAGAVLIASVLWVASANAAVLDGATDAVESAAPPQAPAPAAPPVQVEIPAVPRAPVEALPGPQVPAVQAPVNEAGGATAIPHRASVPSKPPANEIASGEKEPSHSARSASHGETSIAAPSGVGKRPGKRGAAPHGVEGVSVESAKEAPLRGWLAYVWPAVALGSIGKLLVVLQARWETAPALPATDIPRFHLEQAGATEMNGVAGLSEHSTSSNSPPGNSTDSWDPGSGISIFVLLVACAAPIAVLVFSVRRELRSMHR